MIPGGCSLDPLFCVTVFTFALIAIIGVCVLLLKVRINNNKNLRIHIEKYYWNFIMNIGILEIKEFMGAAF